MGQRGDDTETLPLRLDGDASRPKIQTNVRTFTNIVANFFRKNGGAETPPTAQCAQSAPQAILYRHWDAIKAEGITASQFITFLQPLADLDGIAVSYTVSDEDGKAHVYNHKLEDLSNENPLSQAIRDGKVTKEKALTFALNAEGKVWIESNFIELP
jgi:hypothetical protein